MGEKQHSRILKKPVPLQGLAFTYSSKVADAALWYLEEDRVLQWPLPVPWLMCTLPCWLW